MRSWPAPALAVLLAGMAAFAGCSSRPGEPAVPDAPQPEPWSVRYVCGPGHDRPLGGGAGNSGGGNGGNGSAGDDGACYGQVGGGPRTLGEPQVAIDPSHPDTFAIAVSDGRRPDALAEDAPSTEPRGVAVYVTTDGGASFARHAIDLQSIGALPYNPAAMGADPSVAFTPDGVLRLSLLVLTRPTPFSAVGPGFETTLAVLRSADLGASWDAAAVLDDQGYNDRDWLTAFPDGTVALTWRDHTEVRSKAIVGRGAFSGSEPVLALDGCLQVSNPVWAGGALLVGCQEDGGIRAVELGAQPAPRGYAPGACPTNSVQLAATPGGALVAACYTGTMATSLDGGRTWSPAEDVFDRTDVDEDGAHDVLALASDALGMVHFLLSVPAYQDLPTSGGRPVEHLVLDPVAGTVVHKRLLQPGVADGGPAGVGWSDDFYSIAFAGDRGVLVWTSPDWSTRFAVLETGTMAA